MKSGNLHIRIFNQKGFTMVELVIAIIIVAIIAMTASLLIGQAAKSYQSADNYSAINNQDRLALETMAREIRLLRSPADITSLCTSTTSLSFIDSNGNAMNYSYAGSVLTANGTMLADNVTNVAVTYYDKTSAATTNCLSAWSIGVSITVSQGSDALTMRTRIHPRSF
jgi:prepilin-type N-terminal cleavage/methylation domain-containing protein